MKIIDLLNKIAKGENVPERIKYDGEIYVYNYEVEDYEYPEKVGWLMDISRNNGNSFLNDEIEIIEEEKEIEELDYTYVNSYGNISQRKKSEEPIIDKINELVREVNKLKNK